MAVSNTSTPGFSSIEEAIGALPAILRSRQRGIAHLQAILASWGEMDGLELRESIETVLDRLEHPW